MRALKALLSVVALRTATSLAILLGLSFLLFGVLSKLPGDPVELLITADPSVNPDDVLRLKKLRGLDAPWPTQWARWLLGHREPVAPPTAPPSEPIVVELPAEGPARIDIGGRTISFPHAGVFEAHVVIDGEQGLAVPLEAVQRIEVLVGPTLTEVPSFTNDAPGLDDDERHLGGSTEDVVGTGRAAPADLAAAAQALGARLPVSPVRVESANAEGAVVIEGRALSANPGVRFAVLVGPGAFVDGVYMHRFSGPGQTAVVYRATSQDGLVAEGAFLVDHGPVLSDRAHPGALSALLGNTAALGYSSTYKRPIAELLFGDAPANAALASRVQHFGRVQNTLALMLPALLLSLLIAFPLAVISVSRRGSIASVLVQSFSVVSLSMPAFWLGIMAISWFAVRLAWLPAGGAQTPGLDADLATVAVDRLRHAVLPVSVLALTYAGSWTRTLRAHLLEVTPQDFIRTAVAKGLAPGVVLRRHALRHALIPLVTAIGLAVPRLFAGALLTETVFAWPGMGRLEYDAILHNDSYVAVVVLLVTAALILASSLAVDLVCVVLDPRRQGARES